MVIGLGKQKLATVSPVVEAIVNLAASILLARRYGAIGIAWGTLIGAFVGFVVHLCYSMSLTRPVLTFARGPLVIQGLLRPALLLLPTAFLAPQWLHLRYPGWAVIAVAVSSTAALLFFASLDAHDRHALAEYARLPTRLRFGPL
jgi:Na+-driven multidrug efflux pump